MMARPNGYVSYVLLLFFASSALTILLVGFGLTVIPDSEQALEWFSRTYLNDGTTSDVEGCITRNAEIRDHALLARYCSAKHSVPVDGDSLSLNKWCTDDGRVSVTVENIAQDSVFTAFSLRVEDEERASTLGDWIAPGDRRSYELNEACRVAYLPEVTAVGHRGVTIESMLAIPDLSTIQTARVDETTVALQEQGFLDGRGASAAPRDRVDQNSTVRAPEPLDEPADSGSASGAGSVPERAAELHTPESRAQAVTTGDAEQHHEPTPPVAQPAVHLQSDLLQVRESDGAALIRFSITDTIREVGWVDYVLIPGTAVADDDFVAPLTGRLTVDAQATEAAVVVPVVNDAFPEQSETLVIRLASTSENLRVTAPLEALIRIIDDD